MLLATSCNDTWYYLFSLFSWAPSPIRYDLVSEAACKPGCGKEPSDSQVEKWRPTGLSNNAATGIWLRPPPAVLWFGGVAPSLRCLVLVLQRWGWDSTCQLSPNTNPWLGMSAGDSVKSRKHLFLHGFGFLGLLGAFCPESAHPSVTLYILILVPGAENNERCVFGTLPLWWVWHSPCPRGTVVQREQGPCS